MVYFGDEIPDLSDGGKADELNQLAMSDQFRFDGTTGFFYNTDPDCRRKHNLDLEKDHVGFFSGSYPAPKFVEYNDSVTAE